MYRHKKIAHGARKTAGRPMNQISIFFFFQVVQYIYKDKQKKGNNIHTRK